MEYTLIRKVMDAYIVEADLMQEVARISCKESDIILIARAMDLSEKTYGDPRASYIVLDEEGNHINHYDLTHLDQE
jgi:ABC-type sugar transport system ATPase subunit